MDDIKKLIDEAKEFVDCCIIVEDKNDIDLIEKRKSIMTDNDLSKLNYSISNYFSEDSSYGRFCFENQIKNNISKRFFMITNFTQRVKTKYDTDNMFNISGMGGMV